MTASADQIRNQQRETWDKFSAGWKKWDAAVQRWHAPYGEAVIQEARLGPAAAVLDVASGTGEPGLTAAAAVPDGRVILTDLSRNMLGAAQEKAASRGLANVSTTVSDAAALPFGDGTFDAVLCRFGFMFFPDMGAALHEMIRTLKPGGRISAAVWNGPAENPWASTVLDTIARYIEVPVHPAGAPGIFRCSREGLMSGLFAASGLAEVTERTVVAEMVHGSPDVYWQFMTDVAAPVVAGMAAADTEARERIRSEVFDRLRAQCGGGGVSLSSSATVVAGTRV